MKKKWCQNFKIELLCFWEEHPALRMQFKGAFRTLSKRKAKSFILDVWQCPEYIFVIPGPLLKAVKQIDYYEITNYS